MPEIIGIEASAKIRESEKNLSLKDSQSETSIPIIAITAYATSKKCIAVCMVILKKPQKKCFD